MVQEGREESSSEEEFQEDVVTRRLEDKKVILHLDADCYELQVWLNKNHPELKGQHVPMVVKNPDGIMLAVNYAAKKKGIRRVTTRRALEEAIAGCPELVVIQTGKKEGVQDTDTPLEESDKMIKVLKRYRRSLAKPESMIIEVSSRDEFYIDVTELVSSRMRSPFRKQAAEGRLIKGYALPSQDAVDLLTNAQKTFPDERFAGNPVTIMDGRKVTVLKSTLNHRVRVIYPQNLESYHYDEARLVHGAIIAQTLMKMIEDGTGYQLSAGVGHNKLMAKLACSRNKPEGITIMTNAAIPRLIKKLEFQDLPGFGSVTGEKLRAEYKKQTRKELITLQDVQGVGLDKLVELFGRIGVLNPESDAIDFMGKVQLRDDQPVHVRYYSETVSQSMSFKWGHAVHSREQFEERLAALSRLFAGKLLYRFNAHKRMFTQCSVKASMKPNARSENHGNMNTMDLERPPSADAILDFILDYTRANNVYFGDVAQLCLTGSSPHACN